ncbi:hypothetical protein [Ovoidimarina sediminis]|uniref:hypothetical protein n=1 Tax=Ovoidimarina sediminis TaxID=3079856 RepID=UPI0029108C68|nr:hypothetical protein [Rhodophyticola sp. MJ-SS7]MDU8943961.1 hypothetical protein [Rhodophyticola sp. MJ-SS7]
MRPEHLFVLGVLFLAASVPMVIGAFSSSNRTMRGPAACAVAGGILILWAQVIGPSEGFSVNNLPRYAMDMVGLG